MGNQGSIGRIFGGARQLLAKNVGKAYNSKSKYKPHIGAKERERGMRRATPICDACGSDYTRFSSPCANSRCPVGKA